MHCVILFHLFGILTSCKDPLNKFTFYKYTLKQHIWSKKETSLFLHIKTNGTSRYNIRYGKIESDDAELEEASRAADIHSSIETFPDGN